MLAKIVDKMLGFIGFEEVPYEEEQHEESKHMVEIPVSRNNKKGPVFSIHTQRQSRIIVVEPRCHDEVQSIADHLKNRCSVIVNLENADIEIAKRVVDFMSGTTYALDGSMQKIGNGIFVFVPSNVDITAVISRLKD